MLDKVDMRTKYILMNDFGPQKNESLPFQVHSY